MRKKLAGMAVIVIAAVSLASCGSKDNTADTATVEGKSDNIENTNEELASESDAASAQDIADRILAEAEFKDSLSTVEKTMALTRLYELDEAQIEDAAFYTNSQATAEEIAVIKVIDEGYVNTVKNSYEARIEDQKSACQDYLPDEMPKLESAVIYTNGKYVILCISNDNSGVKDIVAACFE